MNNILFSQRSETRRGWSVSKNLIDNEDSHLLLSLMTPICACGCVCVIGGDCWRSSGRCWSWRGGRSVRNPEQEEGKMIWYDSKTSFVIIWEREDETVGILFLFWGLLFLLIDYTLILLSNLPLNSPYFYRIFFGGICSCHASIFVRSYFFLFLSLVHCSCLSVYH